MTSVGANTWNIPLEINNLESQITTVGGSGVQSVVAGTNITITGTATNPIINSSAGANGVQSLTAIGSGIVLNQNTGAVQIKNSGVIGITAGNGIAVSGTGTITIDNTGITSLTAGSGISVAGSTITNTGVRSITAGTNTTITGTATNPIINAVNPVIPSGSVIDIVGTSYAFANPALLANCVLISSVPLQNSGITIDFPSYAQLVSTYGANAIIPFTIANLYQDQPNPYQTIYLTCLNDTNPAKVYFNQSASSSNWVVGNPTPSTSNFVLQRGTIWKGTVILDSVKGNAYYCFTWLTFL